MTFWGRYRKEQSFVRYPAKQRDVYKSRMEDKYHDSIQRQPVIIRASEEEQAEAAVELTRKSSGGFWNALLGVFAGKKEVTVEQPGKARWPAKQ